MAKTQGRFFCINCGEEINSLFKKYSETVLKLSECAKCKQIADKYVEYDVVIVIIDLILFNTQAYRHILLNSEFKNFWKLSVILVLIESYSHWALSNRNLSKICNNSNKTEPSLNDFDMNMEDLKFYIICVNVAIAWLCLIIWIWFITKMYEKFFAKNTSEMTFILVMKTITLASMGVFLQLPSIIWDISLYSYHLHFITLYTCLSQLLAYRVMCNCPKAWCLFVIFSAQYLKNGVSMYENYVFDQIVLVK